MATDKRTSSRAEETTPTGEDPLVVKLQKIHSAQSPLSRVQGRALQRAAAVLSCVTLLLGCAGMKQRSVEAREGDLAAAGFVIKPANTPERQSMLQRLPANRLVTRVNGEEVHYVYADPVVCSCLYVGTQQAHQQFQQHAQQQRLADEQRMTAESYSDAAWNWDAWGPWGPGFGFRHDRGW